MLINKMIREKKINIVYILPTSKKPAGGPKVIYEHSDIINKLKLKNISSEILHLKKKKFFSVYSVYLLYSVSKFSRAQTIKPRI